jgi:hypothetical protein
MYNQSGLAQSRALRRRFLESPCGAVICIDREPAAALAPFVALSKRADLRLFVPEQVSDQRLDDLRNRAERIRRAAEPTPDPPEGEVASELRKRHERLNENRRVSAQTKACSAIPTTFRPLGKAETAALLHHGYMSAMYECSLLMDLPFLEDAASFDL